MNENKEIQFVGIFLGEDTNDLVVLTFLPCKICLTETVHVQINQSEKYVCTRCGNTTLGLPEN